MMEKKKGIDHPLSLGNAISKFRESVGAYE